MFDALRRRFRKKLPARRILMYGLQRSGTNYFEALMHLNYPDALFLNGELRSGITHKHFRLYPDKNIIPEPQFANTLILPDLASFEKQLPFAAPDLYVVISKDPIGWFTSYQRWSKKNNWPKVSHHYIEEYNLFYGMWMQYAASGGHILFIQYDTLLRTPDVVLKMVAEQLGYPVRKAITNTKKVYASKRFTQKKKQEILGGAYRQSLSEEMVQEIKQKVDPSVLSFLGYSL